LDERYVGRGPETKVVARASIPPGVGAFRSFPSTMPLQLGVISPPVRFDGCLANFEVRQLANVRRQPTFERVYSSVQQWQRGVTRIGYVGYRTDLTACAQVKDCWNKSLLVW